MKRLCACAALAGVFGWAAAAAPMMDATGQNEPGTRWIGRTVLSATGLIAAGHRESAHGSSFGGVLKPVGGVDEDSVTRRAELPEPAAFALIGSALLALGVIRRRRQV